MSPLRNFLAAVAVVGVVGTGAALLSHPNHAHATPSVLTDGSIPDVAERVVDSVVNISTSHAVEAGPASFDPFFSNPFSPGFGDQSDRMAMSKGSGVIVTASGRILTNAHVVKDADDIKVTLHDGNDYEAKVIGVDPKGPASRIGLAEGDVVVGLNGTEIRTGDVLRNTIAMIKPGTTIELQVVRKAGNKETLKAKLGELPADNVVPARQLRQRPQGRRPQQQQPQWP